MGRKLIRLARGELLWTVAGFLLIQLGLGFCVEKKLPQVRDPEFAAKLENLLARRAEAPDRPLVVALGSSRTLMGLDAARLSDPTWGHPCLAFNLGLGGSGPMLERVCLNRILKAGIRPNLLLVEVVPMQLLAGGFCPVEDRALDGARLRSSELRLVYPNCADPGRQIKAWLLGRSLPCARHQAELRDWVALDRKPNGEPVVDSPCVIDPYGWAPTGNKTPEEVARAVQYSLNQYRAELHEARLAPGKVQSLRDLLDASRRAGIPTAVMVMPEAAPFRALYPAGLTNEITQLLIDLRREYGLLAMIDARDWVADDGFWDAHHMQPAGARVFTERFSREVLQPLLERIMPVTSRAHPETLPAGRSS